MKKILIYLLAFTALVAGQSQWIVRSPIASSSQLRFNSVVFFNNQYIAVGEYLKMHGSSEVVADSAAIFNSFDGRTWSRKSFGTWGICFYSIACSNDICVVFGYGGILLTSHDGLNWTSRSYGTANSCRSVIYNNGQFIAVGDSGIVLTSIDGINWSSRLSAWTRNSLNCITYGDKGYMAVGSWGVFITSLDAILWVKRQLTDSLGTFLLSVTYGDSQYVVASGSKILTTADGNSWIKVDTVGMNSLTYANGSYIAVGNDCRIRWSKNCITWNDASFSSTRGNLFYVSYCNNKYMAVGYFLDNNDRGLICSSSDGITWTKETVSSVVLTSVIYDDNKFVTVGDYGTIASSIDGINWNNHYSGTNRKLNSVTYGNGQFVTVGDFNTVLTSQDGVAWKIDTTNISLHALAIVYGDSIYVAVGGGIWTSTDGITWTSRYPGGSAMLYSVGYFDSQFVVSGTTSGSSTGVILTSSNGISWTRRYESNSNLAIILSTSFGNQQYIAVGDPPGSILRSSDAITWISARLFPKGDLWSITYANNQFVTGGSCGDIWTSPDGDIWTNRPSGTTSPLFSITSNNNQFVAVGDAGTILTSKFDTLNTATKSILSKSAKDKIKFTISDSRLFISLPYKFKNELIKVAVFNITGQQVVKSCVYKYQENLSMPFPLLISGAYILSITTDSKETISPINILR